jgi:hypothetical protein
MRCVMVDDAACVFRRATLTGWWMPAYRFGGAVRWSPKETSSDPPRPI